MSFGTVINCMDGRVQLQVNEYLRDLWGVDHVDTITEPGPDGILGDRRPEILVGSILDRVAISIEKHGSRNVALVAHADCAGNPGDRACHMAQVARALHLLGERFPDAAVIGLWVGPDWTVERV